MPGKKDPTPQSLEPVKDEEIIELTEVITEGESETEVDEGESETLIELPPELQALDILASQTMRGEESEGPTSTAAPQKEDLPQAEWDQPLDELPPLEPEELEQSGPLPTQNEIESPDTASEALTRVVEAHTVEQLVQKVMSHFDENRLRDLVEGVIREVTEKICRELFPQVAEAVVSREIEALKKNLEDET